MFDSWMDDAIGMKELERQLSTRSKLKMLQQSEKEVSAEQKNVKKRKQNRVASLFYLVCLSV
mgnify:CR=1 FL=1